MKPRFILLGISSILLLLTGCASSVLSVPSEFPGPPPVLSRQLVQSEAEAIIQANPELDQPTAYKIAHRRFGESDKSSKKELKQRAARQKFRDDLAEVLGAP